jgi:hypothetical protein
MNSTSEYPTTLLDLEAHISERPEFFEIIALHHLAIPNGIRRLSRKITDLTADDIAETRVPKKPGSQ